LRQNSELQNRWADDDLTRLAITVIDTFQESKQSQNRWMKKPIRVLIIEDSEFDARILVNVLKQGGYDPQYLRVETSLAMRKAIRESNWDVVLSDYNMPGFTALDALKIIQESPFDLPFIIISGGIGEDTAVAAMKAGAHDYLMKGNLARLPPAISREMREASERIARRKAEAALRESELRYRLLFETATDAVVLIDNSGIIQFANPAVKDVFDYQPSELIGKDIDVLESERLRESHRKILQGYLDSGIQKVTSRTIETYGRRKSGEEILIEIGFGEMKLHDKLWFVGFIRE
jgi:PAS domain S-box-containing protein